MAGGQRAVIAHTLSAHTEWVVGEKSFPNESVEDTAKGRVAKGPQQ